MTGAYSRPGAVLRPVRSDDLDEMKAILGAHQGDLVGMTSLPTSEKLIEQEVQISVDTFTGLATGKLDLERPDRRRVLFLLETADGGQTLGLAGVSFKPDAPNLAVMVLTSDEGEGLVARSRAQRWTRTELNGTFLVPEGRGKGHGTLLSRGRLLFIHLVRAQIPTTIVTHIRGRFDESGSAPFWTNFGARFVPEWPTSNDAELALAADSEAIKRLDQRTVALDSDLLGHLGPVNKQSLGAFRLLRAEGLEPDGMYDPIDGGPTLVGSLDDTASAQRRRVGNLVVTDGEPPNSADCLVSNVSIPHFAVTRTQADLSQAGQIAVSQIAAERLGCRPRALLSGFEL